MIWSGRATSLTGPPSRPQAAWASLSGIARGAVRQGSRLADTSQGRVRVTSMTSRGQWASIQSRTVAAGVVMTMEASSSDSLCSNLPLLTGRAGLNASRNRPILINRPR